MVQLSYTTYISVDLAYHEVFRAKFGKGGINVHVQNFERTPPDVWWINVTCALLCGLSGSRVFIIL